MTFSSSEATAARARRVVPTGTVALASRPSAASADAGWMSELIVGMNKGDHRSRFCAPCSSIVAAISLNRAMNSWSSGFGAAAWCACSPAPAAPRRSPCRASARPSAISCHGPMYSAPPPARGAAAAHAGSLEIERREDTVRDERHDAAEEATERLEVSEVELTPLSEFCTT